MKRDMDIVRRIALATADLPPQGLLEGLDGIDDNTFAMHVQWMKEAGLLHAAVAEPVSGPASAVVMRLTWEGNDFADSVQDETLWSKAKANVIKPTASFTFGLLKDWLVAEIKQGLPSLMR